MNGFIRIISGKWRGRKLPVLNSRGLRPTTDRVKETLFNWLMPFVQDSICLDCYSGSGALGFEALSRGANQVTFIEKNKSVFRQLQQNYQLLHAENSEIINTDTVNWLSNPATKQFNLVFIDPPFNQQLAEITLGLLESNGWLQPNAYIYIETEKSSKLINQIPKNWYSYREKITGQVYSRLFTRVTI